MTARLRQSLALRLALQYAFVFALTSALLFAVLYWLLAGAFDTRERAVLERRVEDIASAYDAGGPAGIIARVRNDTSTDMRALFVRLTRADNTVVFNKWPEDWIETQVQQLLPGVAIKRDILRIPQTAARDYTIASRQLPDGWTLHVGRLMDSQAVFLAPLRRAFAGVGAGALLLSLALGTLLAWRATRPLRAVSDTARRIIATGDLSARVPAPSGGGELAELVRQLNTVLARNATLITAQRETLDNLAHDLRTPLARLRGIADLALQNQGDPAATREALADCLEESERVLRLLETLLDVTAAETGTLPLRRAPVDLRTVVSDAADLYREVAEEKKITVEIAAPAEVMVEADALRLGQVVANLVDNALKYTPAGGCVCVTARREDGVGAIEVSDTGPGVPAEEREKIWRRLYRSDASRSQRGLGLGLSLVKAIVEAHRGTVAVDDASGGGARFTVRLPMA
jgi:signal transduction histidine kinase